VKEGNEPCAFFTYNIKHLGKYPKKGQSYHFAKGKFNAIPRLFKAGCP